MDERSNRQALVSRILTFSCVDGPGNRLVLFLQGCNFNCITCHNPHTINHCNHCGDCIATCPTAALTMDERGKVLWHEAQCTNCDKCTDVCTHNANPRIKRYTVMEIRELVRMHRFFLSGVTVSGGEATTQLPFIIELFAALKSDPELKHLTCFIDSNGHLPQSAWEKVSHCLDGAMIDLKSWQNDTHRWLTGRDNHRVIPSIKYLARVGKLHEVRLLHIPGKSDLDTEVEPVAELLNSLPDTVQVKLNAFQHHGVVGEALDWEKCSEAEMNRFHQLLAARTGDRRLTLPRVYL